MKRISTLCFIIFLKISALAQLNMQVLSHNATNLLNKYSHRNGPNCLNAALLAKNFTSKIEFIESEKFEKVMNKNNCREISLSLLSPGDLILFYNMRTPYPEEFSGLLHATVYVGNGLVFEKKGEGKEYPWELDNLQKAMDFYADENGFYTLTCPPRVDPGPIGLV